MNTVNDLTIEILRKLQADMGSIKQGMLDIKAEINGLRQQFHVMQGDYLRLEHTVAEMRIDIDRIKTRLELNDN